MSPFDEGDAAVRPVLPAPALAVDLDQPADPGARAGSRPRALGRGEALAVGRVRVVEQERAVVRALAAVLLRHDAVAPLGSGAVALRLLVRRARSAPTSAS